MLEITFELIPSLTFINVQATKGFFYLNYPSGVSYWSIQTDDNQILEYGNYTFSQEVLAQWNDSNQILIDTLLAAAPWDIVTPTN